MGNFSPRYTALATGTGAVIANTLLIAAFESSPLATAIRISAVLASLLAGNLCGSIDKACELEACTPKDRSICLSKTDKNNATHLGTIGTLVGGVTALVGTIALHPASGPLLGAMTAYTIIKLGPSYADKERQR